MSESKHLVEGKTGAQVLKEYGDLRVDLAETRGYLKAISDVKDMSMVDNDMLTRALKKHKRTEELQLRDMAAYELSYPEYLI